MTQDTEGDSSDLLRGLGAIGKFLGINSRQAEHWIATKGLPTFKVGRSVCSRRGALKDWLEKRERGESA